MVAPIIKRLIIFGITVAYPYGSKEVEAAIHEFGNYGTEGTDGHSQPHPKFLFGLVCRHFV